MRFTPSRLNPASSPGVGIWVIWTSHPWSSSNFPMATSTHPSSIITFVRIAALPIANGVVTLFNCTLKRVSKYSTEHYDHGTMVFLTFWKQKNTIRSVQIFIINAILWGFGNSPPMQYLQPYWIGCRKHRQGVVVWCDSLPFVALELSFTRNAPLIENGRDLGSVVVSGFWMGTKVDPSIRVIHICQQTKRSL